MKLFTVILFVTLTVVAYSQKHHYIFDKTLQYSDYKIIQNATTQRFFINELLKFKKSDTVIAGRRKFAFWELLDYNNYILNGYSIFLEDIQKVKANGLNDSNTYLISFYRNKYIKDDSISVFIGIDDSIDQNSVEIIKIKYNKSTKYLEFIEGDIFLSKEFLIKKE